MMVTEMTRGLRTAVAALLVPVAGPAASAVAAIAVMVSVRDGVAVGVSPGAVVAGVALVVARLLPGPARPLMRMHGAWRRSVMTAVRALMRPAYDARREDCERFSGVAGRVRGGDYEN